MVFVCFCIITLRRVTFSDTLFDGIVGCLHWDFLWAVAFFWIWVIHGVWVAYAGYFGLDCGFDLFVCVIMGYLVAVE